MKIKYSSIVGILTMLLLIASFVVPAKLATPEPVSAQQPPMEWLPVDTPDIRPGLLKELYSPVDYQAFPYELGPDGPEMGTELTKLLVGNDGTTMYLRYSRGDAGYYWTPNPLCGTDYTGLAVSRLLKSIDGGVSWSTQAYRNLDNAARGPDNMNTTIVWDIAIAPDNPNIVAAAVSTVDYGHSLNQALPYCYQRVYLSTNGGTSWDNTNWPSGLAGFPTTFPIEDGQAYISCIDISMDYGGARDILVGTRQGDFMGNMTNNLQTMKIPGYGGWMPQNAASQPEPSTNFFFGDVIDAKFSPTYIGDSTIVVLYAKEEGDTPFEDGTYLTWGNHDTVMNSTAWMPQGSAVEIATEVDDSPDIDHIITGMIDMPSDYSGQSASLRRVYVCTDGVNDGGPDAQYGVFRVDDNVVYCLMDNENTSYSIIDDDQKSRRAHSIDYWGTYASGKLLVGEVGGEQCTATVPVWFTDSPTVCPVPCWYPAKKPPSGAAGDINCTVNEWGFGNAYVVWSPTYAAQGVAYCVTAASNWDEGYDDWGTWNDDAQQNPNDGGWPRAIFNVVSLDESAFSLTRNNGETWNQLSLIDTRMAKLTDVAPSADCTTIYLASVNNAQCCKGFDSVWRSSVNEKVVAPPLPALPVGSIWERVRHSLTAMECCEDKPTIEESNYIIIRLAPDKADGQVLGWAAGGTSGLDEIGGFEVGPNTKKMEWSPDYGDFWSPVNPRLEVQDFAFESSTILYIAELYTGNVQKMPYTGTAWASSIPNTSTNLGGAHTIEAMAADNVLVGNQAVAMMAATPFAAAISNDGAATFVPMTRTLPEPLPAVIGYHAIFDTDYGVGNNTTIYVGSDANAEVPLGSANTGIIVRNDAPAGANIPWTDMITNFTNHYGYYGLAQSNSKNVSGQGTLYAAHAAMYYQDMPFGYAWYSGVERTLKPLDGIPKPGIDWDCLDAKYAPYQVNGPEFTLEPKSLKLCGCLTQDTNTTLYAIDNWTYSNNHNGPYNCTYGYGANVVEQVASIGQLWSYVDCMAKVGPALTMDDGTIIGCDPATGRAQEVNFTWEQLCIANWYQLRIAKDDAFELVVYDGGFTPYEVTSPALVYYSSSQTTVPESWAIWWDECGESQWYEEPYAVTQLECGHTYYWKVRVMDETTYDEVRSPWSDSRSFTVKAGFRVTTPYYGPQLLAPDNGCGCACDAPICFSWSPFKETVQYKFELSENSDMSSPLVSTTVDTTAYQYTGTVKCNTNYFWRVMAVEPAPSEWSAVFSFMTQPEPPAPAPPAPAPEVPIWVWILIAIGAIFVIVLIVLIFKTRRV